MEKNSKLNTCQYPVWMIQNPRNEGTWGSKKSKKFPGGAWPPVPPRSVRLRHSFMKSVSMCSRSAPGTCSSTAWEVGPSDTLPIIFQKSGTGCFDEWTTGSDRQRRIMNPSRSSHRQTTRRQHLPKREGTSKNSRRFASGKHGGVERSFSCIQRIHTWLRNAMTAGRLSDLAVIVGHVCKCCYHR